MSARDYTLAAVMKDSSEHVVIIAASSAVQHPLSRSPVMSVRHVNSLLQLFRPIHHNFHCLRTPL